MLLNEYTQAEKNINKIYLKVSPTNPEKSVLSLILELLATLKDLLFVGGIYKPVKWYDFPRLYKIASITVKIVGQLIKIIK